MSSGGTIQGTSRSVAARGEHPAAAPATPAAPAIRKKVLRPTRLSLGSDTRPHLWQVTHSVSRSRPGFSRCFLWWQERHQPMVSGAT
jgi:hypothetical protein